MTRIAAITPAHRDHLRRLKADFDRAYADIENVDDRASPSFRAAEALYRAWIKAIDAQALALLDDLDAFDIGGGGPRPDPGRRAPEPALARVRPGEVEHVFAEMDDVLHARGFIDDEGEAESLLPTPGRAWR